MQSDDNMPERIPAVDYTKGLLIILVVVGHYAPGTLENSVTRYVIYSFHMPLFLVVSGYLLNTARLRERRLRGLWKTYAPRVLLPWTIAYVVFNILSFSTELPEHGWDWWLAVLYPWYHLWFVPAFLGMVLLTWAVVRRWISPVALWVLLAVSTTFTLLFPLAFDGFLGNKGLWLYVGDKRIWYYLCFFVLGTCLSGVRISDAAKYMAAAVALAAAAGRLYSFWADLSPLAEATVWLSLNGALGVLTANLFQVAERGPARHPVLAFVGKESLPFYLWHVLPLPLMRAAGWDAQPGLYLSLGLFWFLALIAYLDAANRWQIGAVAIFGRARRTVGA